MYLSFTNYEIKPRVEVKAEDRERPWVYLRLTQDCSLGMNLEDARKLYCELERAIADGDGRTP